MHGLPWQIFGSTVILGRSSSLMGPFLPRGSPADAAIADTPTWAPPTIADAADRLNHGDLALAGIDDPVAADLMNDRLGR
jgi:hypothetical protein